MVTRIISGVLGAVVVLLLLALPQPIPLILIALAWLFCLWEFVWVTGIRLYAVVSAVLAVLLVFSYFGRLVLLGIRLHSPLLSSELEKFLHSWISQWEIDLILFLLMVLVGMILILTFRRGAKAGEVSWLGPVAVFAITYPFLILSALSFVGNSSALLVVVLGIAWVGDVSAIFAGKAFGKIHITPALSPGKTAEGLIGGVAGTAVYLMTLGAFCRLGMMTFPKELAELFMLGRTFAIAGVWLLIAIVIALVGFFGDLTVSAVKRIYGKKDTGTFLPGHGGLWDRVDSLLFIAPLVTLLLALCNAFKYGA